MTARMVASLICWKDEERKQRAEELTRAGFAVAAPPREQMGGVVGYHRELAPDAVVIDLDRMFSYGQELGRKLRQGKATRHLPLVFAGGVAEKVDGLRAELPDAGYCDWDDAAKAIRAAIANAPARPVVPPTLMERFDPANLVHKLDIRRGVKSALVCGPYGDRHGIAELLGELPEGVELGARVTRGTRLALYVAATLPEVEHAFEAARAGLDPAASFWVIHAKSTVRQKLDFNQNHVREAGLRAGFVDYKVASLGAEWSALKFTWPRAARMKVRAK